MHSLGIARLLEVHKGKMEIVYVCSLSVPRRAHCWDINSGDAAAPKSRRCRLPHCDWDSRPSGPVNEQDQRRALSRSSLQR